MPELRIREKGKEAWEMQDLIDQDQGRTHSAE